MRGASPHSTRCSPPRPARGACCTSEFLDGCPEDSGELSFCCGGGGGVIANHRADGLRRRAFALKLGQIEATGAQQAVTSCANCRQSFEDGAAFYHWNGRMGSLLELVAARLA